MNGNFELQIFNGKAYEPVAAGDLEMLRPLNGHFIGKGRRMVKVEKARELVPARYRKPALRAYARPAAQVVREYLEWAKAAGVKGVAFYRNQVAGANYAAEHGIAVRWVDPEDFLGPAPAAEVEPGAIELALAA